MPHDFIDAKKLTARITEVREELAKLLHLESFLSPKAKRGRKPGSTEAEPVKASTGKKAKRGTRGALGESILKFLSAKGKEGAHVKEIAASTGKDKGSITTYFYTTGKKVKGIKKVAPNTYSYVPKDE